MSKSSCLSLIILGLSGCANRVEPARSLSGTWFNCEDDLLFSTERSNDRLLVIASDGRRSEFAAAPTAFGELFRSSDTIVRTDEDFAVLAAGPVLNLARCRQMSRDA